MQTLKKLNGGSWWQLVLLLLVIPTVPNCSRSEDPPTPTPEPVIITTVKEIDLDDPQYEVSDFVWKAMNFWYYWQTDVDLLADSQATDQKKYKKLIEENSDPKSFFQKLRYKIGESDGDRFSWFIDDYIGQEKSFAGISKDHGMVFGLARERPGSVELLGYVRLVHKGSNAKKQGVERGMIFSHVNGTRLTANNYQDLLLDDILSSTLTINLAEIEFDGNSSVGSKLTGKSITLTKEENFVADPVVHKSVLEISDKKIGYLFYNQFIGNERNLELNNVFGEFKTAGIDELIVDLRYNGGGAGFTADVMATAISGRNGDDIISIAYYNQKCLDAFFEGEPAVEYFPQEICKGGRPCRPQEIGEVPINKLDLSRVFFITSERSASASEGLINNLNPWMDVIIVGDRTTGKNEGSVTVYDLTDREPEYYFSRENGDVNPNHKYALQPLILKTGNADGFLDFENGLVPDIPLEEDRLRLGEIGDPTESLLARVLQEIVPSAQRTYTHSEDVIEFESFDWPEDKKGIWHFELDEKFFKD